jgi:polar amino acid transport system permease protein
MPSAFRDVIERPWFPWLLLFAVVAVAAAVADLRETTLGVALAPALGVPGETGWFARLAIAAVLGVVVAGNFAILRVLPFKAQVAVVWAELLALALAFFYSFDLSFPFIFSRLGFLIYQGAFTTVYVSMAAILIACVIALAAALARLSQNGPAYGAATFYISFFRGTPLLLQVYLIYLGLPQLGFVVDAVPSGIAALALCYGAYMAEIFRAGIQGVPPGQWEAATALGLKQSVTFWKVVFPQAMRLIVPPTGNQFIAMLKDSSLVSVMGVWELMFLAKTQGRAEFKHLEMLITAAIIYWIISFAFELIQGRIETYYGKGHQR